MFEPTNIKKKDELSRYAVIVFANALYFKGSRSKSFVENLTKRIKFKIKC